MKLLPERKSRLYFLLLVFGLIAAAPGVYRLVRDLPWEEWRNRPRLYTTSSSFHDTIRRADRLVVREGGFNCCGPVRGEKVLFEITDPDELAEIYDNIQFRERTNAKLGACMCCGFPGMDWYRGWRRLALTSVQHGKAIRWKGFPAGNYWPGRGYAGDAPLTHESSIWLTEWLIAHGFDDLNYSAARLEKLREWANKEEQAVSR
jgi:hypothetical protein